MRLSTLATLATATIALGGSPIDAQPFAPGNGRANKEKHPYIVVMKEGRTAGTRAAFDRHRRLENVPATTVELSETEARQIAADPEVEFVAPDREVRANLDIIGPTVNANVAWVLGRTGTGVGIAVIDSGINDDFKDLGDAFGKTGVSSTGAQLGRVVYSENFLEPKRRSDGTENPKRYEGKDEYGHGTHIAGIIAGNGYYTTLTGSTRLMRGIAPTAKLINLKVLDKEGKGTDSLVIEAIDRAIALKGKHDIKIINLSLGRRVYTSFLLDPLCKAVEKAWKAGIVVVVAAGNEGRLRSFQNDGYGTIQSPANSPFVITVGATRTAGTSLRSDDEITTYSSKGPTPVDHIVKPDLVAPGNLIDSALTSGFLSNTYPANVVDPLSYSSKATLNTKSNYLSLSGTSMAAAVVSGAVACLLHSESKLTPDQVKARLMLTATKDFRSFGTFYFDYSVKVRKLNLAIQRARLSLPEYQKVIDDAQRTFQSKQTTYSSTVGAYEVATNNVVSAQGVVDAARVTEAQAQSAYNAAVATATLLRQQADAADAYYLKMKQVYDRAKTPENYAAMVAALDAYKAEELRAKAAEDSRNAAKRTLDNAKSAVRSATDRLNSALSAQASAKTRMDAAAADLAVAQSALDAANLDPILFT